MRALIVSGYSGEPDGKGRRKPLTSEQLDVAQTAIHEAMVWLEQSEPNVLIHGSAPGVDGEAAGVARQYAVDAILPMPAQWRNHGKRAGILRNEAMLKVLRQLRDCGYECRVLCLPGPQSRGTRHMERISRDAEFAVTVQELP